ncbi:hypothetical protein [Bacillus sinesaloumensis]|uniref:hypothetical protein n=1 Tax=Litchfieldia sinesaloumensis TaxID=1926280 RepID=UPI0009884FB1|nr:hypothetical protein [Bacillus sinesaloumensis]
MNKPTQLLVSVVLVFLTVTLFVKGLELWSIGSNVDGDGIGIYFLGMEINDRVPVKSIPGYTTGFFILSFAAFLITIALARKTFLSENMS